MSTTKNTSFKTKAAKAAKTAGKVAGTAVSLLVLTTFATAAGVVASNYGYDLGKR